MTWTPSVARGGEARPIAASDHLDRHEHDKLTRIVAVGLFALIWPFLSGFVSERPSSLVRCRSRSFSRPMLCDDNEQGIATGSASQCGQFSAVGSVLPLPACSHCSAPTACGSGFCISADPDVGVGSPSAGAVAPAKIQHGARRAHDAPVEDREVLRQVWQAVPGHGGHAEITKDARAGRGASSWLAWQG